MLKSKIILIFAKRNQNKTIAVERTAHLLRAFFMPFKFKNIERLYYFSLLSVSTALDCFGFATGKCAAVFLYVKKRNQNNPMLTKTKTTSAVDAIALLNECIKNIRSEMKTHTQVQVSTTLNNGLAETILIDTPTFGLNLQLK